MRDLRTWLVIGEKFGAKTMIARCSEARTAVNRRTLENHGFTVTIQEFETAEDAIAARKEVGMRNWLVEQQVCIGAGTHRLSDLHTEEEAKEVAKRMNLQSINYIYTARQATEVEVAQIDSIHRAARRHEEWVKAQCAQREDNASDTLP